MEMKDHPNELRRRSGWAVGRSVDEERRRRKTRRQKEGDFIIIFIFSSLLLLLVEEEEENFLLINVYCEFLIQVYCARTDDNDRNKKMTRHCYDSSSSSFFV